MKERINLIIKILIFLISLILFIILALKVFNKEIFSIDINYYNLISKYISNSNTLIFKIITHLGSSLVLISIALLIFLIIKNRKIGISICLNLTLIAILNVILKNIIARPRPNIYPLINETSYSFPSGHSMISAAFYGYLIYLIYKHLKDKKIKWLIIILLGLIVILIGLSRIYLGVHYLSDVIAGFLIAVSYLIVYIEIIKKLVGGSNEINK